MSEQLHKDLKRVQDVVDRMGSKVEAEGKAVVGSIIGKFADLVEGIEKHLVPPTKTEQDSTKK